MLRSFSSISSLSGLLYLVLVVQVAGNWVSSLRKFAVSANPINDINHTTAGSNTCNNSSIDSTAEMTIQKFLSSVDSKGDKFYIQGWRWHNLSLIRDTERLQKYALSMMHTDTSESRSESLKKAVNHVIDFNLKGLKRIEDDVFFPWLRQKLTEDDAIGVETKNAFQSIIDDVDRDRKRVDELASDMRSEVKNLLDSNNEISLVEKATMRLSSMSNSISSITKSIKDREDRLLVPAVTKLVSPREQKSFNNKVLRNLGIFESRCHLVGMHDAVYDDNYGNEEEQSLFLEQIPSVARMMIGRWRRSLYEPQAGMLDA